MNPKDPFSVSSVAKPSWPYTWAWDECSGCRLKGKKPDKCPPRCKGYRPMYRGRKGKRCRAVRFGAKGTVLVEFEDGAVTVASRHGLRKASHHRATENTEETTS